MEIKGLTVLVEQLRARAAKSVKEDNVSVIVGYTAAYALYVHERIEMKWKGLPRPGSSTYSYKNKDGTSRSVQSHGFYWDPQGRAQAKFLETPARRYQDQIGDIVRKVLSKKGATLAQALLMGGLFLQRQSMLLVPVDTGNLKASAFTRLEREGEDGADSNSDS